MFREASGRSAAPASKEVPILPASLLKNRRRVSQQWERGGRGGGVLEKWRERGAVGRRRREVVNRRMEKRIYDYKFWHFISGLAWVLPSSDPQPTWQCAQPTMMQASTVLAQVGPFVTHLLHWTQMRTSVLLGLYWHPRYTCRTSVALHSLKNLTSKPNSSLIKEKKIRYAIM